MDNARCKENVFSNWHHYQCSRKIWKDGYCKQHHPDTVQARKIESEQKYKERYQQSAYGRLQAACRRIKELEAEVERLEKRN